MKITEIFSEPPSNALLGALERTGTPYELLLGTVYFRLVQGSAAYCEILPIVGQKDRVLLAAYSEAERKAAAWLEISPKSQTVELLNLEVACQYRCTDRGADGQIHARHCQQVAPYEIPVEIQWGKRKHFAAPDSGGVDVFTSGAVRELVERAGLVGCVFRDVRNQKTGAPCRGTFQLLAHTEIPCSAISFGHGETEYTCPLCGEKQYLLSNIYQFHLFRDRLPEGVDMLRTPPIFHDGQAEAVTFISQRFYQALKEAGLHGGLNFTPVILLS